MALSMDANWLNPLYWVGPVLDKELRVLSRRKRTYWIKGLFPVCLGLVVLSGWFAVGRGGGLSAAGLEKMAQLSRSVVSSMTWLQFILCQCMAVMMMSHAMHDEIRRRTLDVLMTTPIRSVQIVLGKLFGQLMMVWVVLALSFPVLAIVRVWGGVPWEYLTATSCVTVCATLCVAAFSLLVALWAKRSHHAILIVLSFLVLGYISGMLAMRLPSVPTHWVTLFSPFSVFYALSASFNSASGQTAQGLWVPHCGITLGVGGVFVMLCVVMLRRRTLTTIRGTRRDKRFWGFVLRVFLGRKKRQDCAIRTVTDSPILWKELGCSPQAYFKKQLPWIGLLSAGLIASLIIHVTFFQMFVSWLRFMVLLRVSVMAAVCVAQEKEARTWPALLCTPIPDIWLLRHKAMAVLFKNASGWVPVIVGSAVSLLIQTQGPQPRVISFMGLFNLITTLYLITGMGLYASVRMKTASMAITAMLIAWFIWQLVMQFAMVLVMVNLRAFGGGLGGPPMLMYYVLTPILSVVTGAVAFKLSGRNLRRYAF